MTEDWNPEVEGGGYNTVINLNDEDHRYLLFIHQYNSMYCNSSRIYQNS